MAEEYVLHEGEFGRAAVMRIRESLVEHAHSDAHIVCWLGGSPAVARVGSQEVYYSETLASGTNAYEPHDFKLLDPSRPALMLALYISKEWLEMRRQMTGLPLIFSSPYLPIDSELRRFAARAADTLLESGASSDEVDAEFSNLIATAMDTSSCEASVAPCAPEVKLDFRLRRALSYMRTHSRERIDLRDVASEVGLSRAHFFTLFRKQLNTTPQVFWSTIRLEEAIDALIYDDESLTNVSIDLGFSASSNFSRFFKEHTGASPAEYRRAGHVPGQKRRGPGRQSHKNESSD